MGWSHSELVAEVYDLDKPIGFSYGDVEYYTEALAGVGGRVLELACGTGRILVPLLAAGLRAEGLDHSPEMIEVCRRNCRDRGFDPALHVADMSEFDLPGPYEAIVIPSGSVKDLDGRDRVLSALRRCHDALTPGGRLIVDVAPPATVRSDGAEPLRHWRRGDLMWTLQTLHLEYDAAANRTTQFLRYEKWRDGALVATELHTFCIQYWSLGEFHGLLAEAGFGGVEVTAGYQPGRRPGPRDDDWTFHAVRPQ